MDIKVIETKYRGYKFRSRMEARWAVFFDEIGVVWEYEKEGYDFNGIWYLPDFWIHDWDCFVEVKGDPAQLEDGLEKCRLLREMTGKICFVLYGTPDYDLYQMIFPGVEIDGDVYYGIENPNKILQCRRCDGHWYCQVDGLSWGPLANCNSTCTSDKSPYLSDQMSAAHDKAKSYRF
jgi:hypothetical protein